MNKSNIAVVYGGDSSEYVVSVKSGRNVFNSIDRELFNPWLVELRGKDWKVMNVGEAPVDVDKSDFSFYVGSEKICIDFAYVTIHGTPGEDGTLQGYFDLLKIPYSSCGVQASALTFNKYMCSNYLRSFGIPMASSVIIKKGQSFTTQSIVDRVGLPVFVKPNAGGSSFGVTKVKNEEDLSKAIEMAWKENSDALIESFIDGREFTCGLVKLKNKQLVFPVTEVLPKNEFFDYEAKYTKGMTEEITPARLDQELTDKIQSSTSLIYDLCFCKGIVRIDFILKNNIFYFLEVNTTPGMTETSFIPQQLNAMGCELKDMFTFIINDGLLD